MASQLKISSPAFRDNDRIPQKYTCDERDVSPPLRIENVPPKARSLVLIVDDPDAPGGTWTHWILWNIDPGAKEIRENTLPDGAVQGLNDFKSHEYGGPCPPSGTHRYFFKLYALDTLLDLPHDSERTDVERAMAEHVLAQARIVGLYERAPAYKP